MSALAKRLPQPSDARVRRGPNGACDIYGDGDLEDWAAVERLRLSPGTWALAQHHVDQTLGIQSMDEHKFRYHWGRKCWHWSPEQRAVKLADLA